MRIIDCFEYIETCGKRCFSGNNFHEEDEDIKKGPKPKVTKGYTDKRKVLTEEEEAILCGYIKEKQ